MPSQVNLGSYKLANRPATKFIAGLFNAYPLIAGLFDAYPKASSTKMIAGLFDTFDTPYSKLELKGPPV